MPEIDRRSMVGWILTSAAGTALAQEPGKPPVQAPATAAPKPGDALRGKPIDAPIDVEVPVPPTPFQGDGKTHLVYEIHLTNFGRQECTLTRIEVLSADRKSLANYTSEDLARWVMRPGPAPKEPLRIDGGLRAVLFLWITLDSGAPVPSGLDHRIGIKVADSADEFTSECARVPVRPPAIVIGPPMRGGEWLAANGPANGSGHRRALIPVGGGVHIAQRFAIDWLELHPDGMSFKGDRLDNKNYRCWGQDAIAVADSVVVAVKDGIPENVPGVTSRAVPITLETVGGNHVILDLGGGRFGFYAHLQPGRIRVRAGDQVKRGQVLGLVGNSGNSTEPHLHFHISDGNSPLASEGLPYAFTSFEVQGKGFSWKPSNSTATPDRRSNELPLQNQVVRFS